MQGKIAAPKFSSFYCFGSSFGSVSVITRLKLVSIRIGDFLPGKFRFGIEKLFLQFRLKLWLTGCNLSALGILMKLNVLANLKVTLKIFYRR